MKKFCQHGGCKQMDNCEIVKSNQRIQDHLLKYEKESFETLIDKLEDTEDERINPVKYEYLKWDFFKQYKEIKDKYNNDQKCQGNNYLKNSDYFVNYYLEKKDLEDISWIKNIKNFLIIFENYLAKLKLEERTPIYIKISNLVKLFLEKIKTIEFKPWDFWIWLDLSFDQEVSTPSPIFEEMAKKREKLRETLNSKK